MWRRVALEGDSMVIFLDLDGVINCRADWVHPYSIRPRCVKALAKLVKSLNADIVLTSSWKTGWVRVGKCTPQIEQLKRMFGTYGMGIAGRARNLGNRSAEISDYCHRHGVTDFLILDDDLSLFTTVKNIYRINPKKGLTDSDANVIIRKYREGWPCA